MSDQQKELLANIAPFGLRMQAELKDRMKAAAEENGRSLNAEIIHRLELSLENDLKISSSNITSLDQIVNSFLKQIADSPRPLSERDQERFYKAYADAKKQETDAITTFMRITTELIQKPRPTGEALDYLTHPSSDG